MSTEKLSTGFELSTASLKKREGKKKPSPLNPYKEKGKGKEGKPGANGTSLFARAGAHTHVRGALLRRKPGANGTSLFARAGAHTHVRGALLRRHVNAAVEDALVAFCGTRGPAPSDEALWAKFAWRFGFGMLHELTEQAPSERPRILQNLLNEVWYGRYPKKGGRA